MKHLSLVLVVLFNITCILVQCAPLTFTVTSGADPVAVGLCTLRGALQNALTLSQVDTNCPAGTGEGDIIVIAVPEVVMNVTGIDEDNAATGDFDIGTPLTIRGVADDTRINGFGLDRIFDVIANVSVTFQNLVLFNGTDQSSDSIGAGAIRSIGPITLNQMLFLENTAEYSGSQSLIAGAVAATESISITGAAFVNNSVVSTGTLGAADVSVFMAGALASQYDGDFMHFEEFFCNGNEVPMFDAAALDGVTALPSVGGFGVFGQTQLFEATGAGALNVGGFALFWSQVTDVLFEFSDIVHDNIGVFGGAFQSYATGTVQIIGDGNDGLYLRDNGATFIGGGAVMVVNASQFELRDFVAIEGNSGPHGGAILLIDVASAIIKNISSIENNAAFEPAQFVDSGLQFVYDSSGGAVHVTGASFVEITNVTRLTNNSVSLDSGGFAQVEYGAHLLITAIETITQNNASFGGVLGVYNGTVAIYNVSAIEYNVANDDNGGVAYLEADASLSIDTVDSISYNYADFYGGVFAIYSGSQVEVRNVDSISYNTGFEGTGVAELDTASVTFEQVRTIDHNVGDVNTVEYGAGVIYIATGNVTLRDIDELSNNNGGSYGGVIVAYFANVQVYNVSRVEANSALFAGVAYIADDSEFSFELVDQVSDNIATNSSGGVFAISGSNATVQNVQRFTNNTAFQGGVVACDEGANVLFNNINSIDNNTAQGTDSDGNESQGGVAYVLEAELTISNVPLLIGNTGRGGGVVYCENSTLSVSDVDSIAENTARNGAVVCSASNSTAVIERVDAIQNNHATSGGAFYVDSGDLLVRDTRTISHNTALVNRGGVLYAANDADVTLDSVDSLSYNSATFGGVVYVEYALVTLTNISQIEYNTASQSGGVLSCFQSGNFTLEQIGSLSYNTADNSGGAIQFDPYLTSTDFLRATNVSSIISNRARFGGVMYVGEQANVIVDLAADALVENNVAADYAGVAYFGDTD